MNYVNRGNFMDIREGIYLLDSYFFDIIGKIYHTVPLHAINGNIASLKKFYRFLEANKVVPTGTYSRLNEEIRDKKDDWLMMARGIRPKERSYRGTRLIKLIKEYSKLSPWTRLTDLDVFAIEFSDEEDIFNGENVQVG